MQNFPPLAFVVNFLILAAALVFFTRKPMKSFMASRSDEIKKNLEESERLQQEALSMVKNYETKLANLDREIKTMIQEARDQGEKEKQQILERAKKMSDQIIESASTMAAQELMRQKNKLQGELMKKVLAEALIALKSKASEKDHQQFTDQFIAQMEEQNGDRN